MELNREQIIKALECCVKVGGYRDAQYCNDCPLHEERCALELPRNCLALVKQLTEENERLREELAKAYVALDNSMNFYCSFTQHKIDNCPIEDEVSKAKADTVREFAEALKDRIHPDADHSGYELRGIVDQIAKEMLED